MNNLRIARKLMAMSGIVAGDAPAPLRRDPAVPMDQGATAPDQGGEGGSEF